MLTYGTAWTHQHSGLKPQGRRLPSLLDRCRTINYNGGMSYKDPDKRRAYQREWLRKQRRENTPYAQRQQANRPKQRLRDRERANEYRREYREKIFLYIAEWRDEHRICSICGKQYPPLYLELHHPNGDGRGNITRYATSLKRVKQEMKRCWLICRKCHKAEHRKMKD